MLKQLWIRLLVTLLCASVCSISIAALTPNGLHPFDIQHANQSITQITNILETQKSSLTRLKSINQNLEQMKDEATDCAEKSTNQLESIEQLLKISTNGEHINYKQVDIKFLNDKKQIYSNRIAECRLISLKARELALITKSQIQKISHIKTFSRTNPIWHSNLQSLLNLTNLMLIALFLISFATLYMSSVNFWPNRFNEIKHPLQFFSCSLLALIIFSSMAVIIDFTDIEKTFFTRLILSITLASGAWLFTQATHRVWLKMITLTILTALLLIDWLGYHNIVFFTSTAIFLSLAIVISTYFLLIYVDKAHHNINYSQSDLAKTIHNLIGVRLYRAIPELAIARALIVISILLIDVLLLMHIWSFPIEIIDQYANLLTEGMNIAELTIIPAKIISAGFTFIILFLSGRILSTYIASHQRFSKESDTQVALSTITNYLSFSIALLTALMVLGINFTGLAIIAGALSVGIGFGLQTIVNNFICGLILLLQKPVKPGDRVVVADTEGHVKRIRILSTQIQTLSKEDVIIPNSYLVSNPITNLMFRDQLWRVICQVGVAYGSDIAKVKQVLLDVANRHPDVIKDAPNQPAVLFRQFGDSSLEFELWCIIEDVNKKYHIQSDLNILIDAAFRQHQITIAFPQRDVHLYTTSDKASS